MLWTETTADIKWAECCSYECAICQQFRADKSCSIPALLQALEALRKLRTEKTAEIKQFRLQLEHLKTHKVRCIATLLSPLCL